MAYMVTDDILGSRALTMPEFAKVADQLIARHYARTQRGRRPGAPSGATAGGPSWQAAKAHVERAIQRHGRDGRAAALADLAQHDELLVRFVERVRWVRLCEEQLRYAEPRYREIWGELLDSDTERQERAAC